MNRQFKRSLNWFCRRFPLRVDINIAKDLRTTAAGLPINQPRSPVCYSGSSVWWNHALHESSPYILVCLVPGSSSFLSAFTQPGENLKRGFIQAEPPPGALLASDKKGEDRNSPQVPIRRIFEFTESDARNGQFLPICAPNGAVSQSGNAAESIFASSANVDGVFL